MNKLRVYIDTSVIGGYFDKEFSLDTINFFNCFFSSKFIFVVSDLMEAELSRAPKLITDFFHNLSSNQIEKVSLTIDAKYLAQQYILENVVGKTSLADCQHIAMATLTNADVLASWNFKHIVNFARIKGYNQVNFKNNLNYLEIRTPKEITCND